MIATKHGAMLKDWGLSLIYQAEKRQKLSHVKYEEISFTIALTLQR